MLTNLIPEGFTSAGDENGTCADAPENGFWWAGLESRQSPHMRVRNELMSSEHTMTPFVTFVRRISDGTARI